MNSKLWRVNATANVLAGGINSVSGLVLSAQVVKLVSPGDLWLWFASWQVFSVCQTLANSGIGPLVRFLSVNSEEPESLVRDKRVELGLQIRVMAAMLLATLLTIAIYAVDGTVSNKTVSVFHTVASLCMAAVACEIFSQSFRFNALCYARGDNVRAAYQQVYARLATYSGILLGIMLTKSVFVGYLVACFSAAITLVLIRRHADKSLRTVWVDCGEDARRFVYRQFVASIFMNTSIMLMTAGVFQYLSLIGSRHTIPFGFANIIGIAVLALLQAVVQPLSYIIIKLARANANALAIGPIVKKAVWRTSLLILMLLAVLHMYGEVALAYLAQSELESESVALFKFVVCAHALRAVTLPVSVYFHATQGFKTLLLPTVVEVAALVTLLFWFGEYRDGYGVGLSLLGAAFCSALSYLLLYRRLRQ